MIDELYEQYMIEWHKWNALRSARVNGSDPSAAESAHSTRGTELFKAMLKA